MQFQGNDVSPTVMSHNCGIALIVITLKGREEEKYRLTRLISDRAAISDPSGVMYPGTL